MCFNSKSKRLPLIDGYRTEEFIGAGGNSKVYRVVSLDTKETLAAKVIKPAAAGQMPRVLKEVELMR
jgi:serine/threonine protein kinase